MLGTLPVLLATAALAAAAQVSIPLPFTDVPLTLQSAVVCFSGLTLGLGRALLAVLLYLGLGAAGLPVFAEGERGLDVLTGPTGGYLVGFLAALPVMSLTALGLRSRRRMVQAGFAALMGHAVILVLGVVWLQQVAVWSWYRTLEAGFWPFLPGALIKSVVVGLLVAWVQAPDQARPKK